MNAIDNGLYADELVPVGDFDRRGPAPRHVLREALQAQARLRPGGHDDRRKRAEGERRRQGAVVTSEEFAKKRGLEVLATIVSQAYVADDFAYLAERHGARWERALARPAGRSATSSAWS